MPDFQGVCDFDKASSGLVPVAAGDVGEVRLRRARVPRGRTLAESLGRSRRRSFAPLNLDRLPLLRAPALPVRLQLEGLRRQLPRRRVPRPAPPQGSRQRARLRQLHDRERRPVLPAVEPGRLRGRGCRDRRRAAGSERPLLLDLPELDGQLVRGADGHEPRPARSAPTGRKSSSTSISTDVSEAARRAQPRERSKSASASRTRTLRSAIPCSAASARARTRPGRLSVRREGGEHLFHRLLAADLREGLTSAR